MSTLSEYAHQQYPNHSTDLWQGRNPPLQDHTVVVHVIGRDTAERTIGLLQRSQRTDEVAAVLVHGSDPTVVPTEGEDRDGVADLPNRRVLIAALAGAAIGAVVALLVGAAMSLAGGAILALVVFLGATGLALGGIIGGARFASERAGTQVRAPGADIGVVAALVGDEQTALELADDLGAVGLYDVRIVSSDGAWRAP